MSQEPSEGSVTVPDSMASFVEAQAEELSVSEADVVRQLLAAYRTATADEDGEVATREDVEGLRVALADAEREFDDKIQDVRERVVQVKRETDAKAPADHGHPDVTQRAEQALEAARTLRSDVNEVRAATEELRETLEEGFENYEDVLSYLLDASDDAADKLDILARSLVEVRTSVQTLSNWRASQAAIEALAAEANRKGIRRANCEECGGTVDVALLVEPRCPHCDRGLTGVRPKQGWFDSPTLEVGDLPAIEAGEPDPATDIEEIFDGDAASAPTFAGRDAPAPFDDGTGGEDEREAAPDDPPA